MSAITLSLVEGDAGRLMLPILVLVNIAVLHFAVLWRRDGELPIFEIGSLCVAATLVYSAMPFVNFVINGLQWGPDGDGRLHVYEFDLDVLAAFAWRYVTYLGSFVVVYVGIRGRRTAAGAPLGAVPARLFTAFGTVFVLQLGFERLLYLLYGLDFDVSYHDLPTTLQPAEMPYILWQLTLIVFASMLLVKQGLVLFLIRGWHDLRWRIALVTWMCYEVTSVAFKMGARGQAVRLVLTFAVLYHRFVRPMRPFWVGVGGASLLVAFLVQGVVRQGSLSEAGFGFRDAFASSNEFQALFATAYDLYQRKANGTLPSVPWQIYVSDLYMIVPSQVLPFHKWNPADWYLEVLGAQGTGVGFMFGVMAQAVLGFDWIELAARGALLGLVFALLHRWYARHARRFWPTLFYLFVTVWSYYTFRATTFYIVHFVVYQFVSVMILVSILDLLARRRGMAKSG